MPSKDWVHILLVTPDRACYRAYFNQFGQLILSVFKHLDEIEGLGRMKGWHVLSSVSPVYSVFVAQSALLAATREASSPTESVEDPDAMQGVVESTARPWYGRPSHRFGPPTALFNEQLANLKRELEDVNISVSVDD